MTVLRDYFISDNLDDLEVLEDGKHVFFVDLLPEQKGILDELLKKHTALERAGTEPGTAAIIMKGQKQIPHFLREVMP